MLAKTEPWSRRNRLLLTAPTLCVLMEGPSGRDEEDNGTPPRWGARPPPPQQVAGYALAESEVADTGGTRPPLHAYPYPSQAAATVPEQPYACINQVPGASGMAVDAPAWSLPDPEFQTTAANAATDASVVAAGVGDTQPPWPPSTAWDPTAWTPTATDAMTTLHLPDTTLMDIARTGDPARALSASLGSSVGLSPFDGDGRGLCEAAADSSLPATTGVGSLPAATSGGGLPASTSGGAHSLSTSPRAGRRSSPQRPADRAARNKESARRSREKKKERAAAESTSHEALVRTNATLKAQAAALQATRDLLLAEQRRLDAEAKVVMDCDRATGGDDAGAGGGAPEADPAGRGKTPTDVVMRAGGPAGLPDDEGDATAAAAAAAAEDAAASAAAAVAAVAADVVGAPPPPTGVAMLPPVVGTPIHMKRTPWGGHVGRESGERPVVAPPPPQPPPLPQCLPRGAEPEGVVPRRRRTGPPRPPPLRRPPPRAVARVPPAPNLPAVPPPTPTNGPGAEPHHGVGGCPPASLLDALLAPLSEGVGGTGGGGGGGGGGSGSHVDATVGGAVDPPFASEVANLQELLEESWAAPPRGGMASGRDATADRSSGGWGSPPSSRSCLATQPQGPAGGRAWQGHAAEATAAAAAAAAISPLELPWDTQAVRLGVDATNLGDLDAAEVAAQAASLAVPLGGWAALGRAAPPPEPLLAPPPPLPGHRGTYAGDGSGRVGGGGIEAPASAHVGAARGARDGEGAGFPGMELGERWTMQAPTAGHAPTSQPPLPPPPPPPRRRNGGR